LDTEESSSGDVGNSGSRDGGEVRKSRVRGFAPWRPTTKSQALLETVQAILTEYLAYLPLTIRQIFYRLVGVHEYPKTERAYKNLCELLNRARRSGLVKFSAIRDDGIDKREPFHWASAAQFVQSFVKAIDTFRLDRQAPDELVQIISDAITSRLDRAAYDAVLAKEKRAKAQLRRKFQTKR